MKTIIRSILVQAAGLWKETQAQDIMEYAIMAGFVAVAAGAILPDVTSGISTLFSKISSSLVAAGG